MCEAQKTTQDDIRVWGSDSSLNPSEAPPTTPIKPRRRPPATFMTKQKSAPDLTTPSVWGIVQAVQKIQADDGSSIYSEIFGKSVVPDFRAPTPHTEPKKKLVVHQTTGRGSERLNQVPATLDMSVTSKTNSEGYSQIISKAEQGRIRENLMSPVDDDAISEITSSIRSSKKTKRSSGKRSSRMLKKPNSLPDLFIDQEKESRSFTDLTLCSNPDNKLTKSTSDRSLGSKKSLRSRSKNRLRKSSSDRSLIFKRSSRSPSKTNFKKSISDNSLSSKKLSRSHSKNKLRKSSSDRSLGSRRSSRSPSKTKLKKSSSERSLSSKRSSRSPSKTKLRKSTSPSGKRSSLRSSETKLKKSNSDNCLTSKKSKRKGLKKSNSSPSLTDEEEKANKSSTEWCRSKSGTRKRRTKKPRSKSTSMLVDPTTCTEAAISDPTFYAETEALKAEFEDRLRKAELKLEAELRSNNPTPAPPQRKQGAHEEERIRVFAESMRRSQSLSPSKYKIGAVDGSRVVVTNDRRFKNRWSKVQPTPPSMPTMQRRWSTADRGRPPAIIVL